MYKTAMRAFVLSGGGNRGPLQVGAIKVLLENGIVPEMIAGSSVGALNGAFIAIDPTLQQAERMAQLWRDAGARKLFTASPLKFIANALRGKNHFVDNKAIRAYVQQALPPGVRTFGDLRVPLYTTLVHLLTQTLYVYGDDPGAALADAVVTSAAVPGFFPPAYFKGQAFVDGGVISNLPLKLAVSRGATEIWAIDLSFEVDPSVKLKSAFDIIGYTTKRPLYGACLQELEWATQQPGLAVHHISISAFQNIALGDFSKSEAMFAEGDRVARNYLANPLPNAICHPRAYAAHSLPAGPPGSRPFVEPSLGVFAAPSPGGRIIRSNGKAGAHAIAK
jgi:NTE family protein